MNIENIKDNQPIQSINFVKDIEEYAHRNNSRLTVSEVLNKDYTHSMKHVTFLLPAYNEEESIGTLLRTCENVVNLESWLLIIIPMTEQLRLLKSLEPTFSKNINKAKDLQ